MILKNHNLLMWAHYAARHSGVCLGFSTQAHPFNTAFEVVYRDTRPSHEYTDTEEDLEAEMLEMLLVKSKHWEYEREWRLVRHLLAMGAGPGLKPFSPASLCEIVFGCRIRAEDRDQILGAIEPWTPSPSIFLAVPDERHFRLNVGPFIADAPPSQ